MEDVWQASGAWVVTFHFALFYFYFIIIFFNPVKRSFRHWFQRPLWCCKEELSSSKAGLLRSLGKNRAEEVES